MEKPVRVWQCVHCHEVFATREEMRKHSRKEHAPFAPKSKAEDDHYGETQRQKA